MAFEPRRSIADIMTAYAGSFKSPAAGLFEGYMRGTQMRQRQELLDMEREKHGQAKTDKEQRVKAFEQIRPQLAQAFGVDPNTIPVMDLDDANDLYTIHTKANEQQRQLAADKLEDLTGMLYAYQQQSPEKRRSNWSNARGQLIQKYPELAKELPEQYDENRILQQMATSNFGRDVLKARTTGAAESHKPTNSGREYQEMLQLGVPEPVAQGIAYGTYKTVSDPASGATLIIDLRSNQPVGRMTPSDPGNPYNSPYVWQPTAQQRPQQGYNPMAGTINRGTVTAREMGSSRAVTATPDPLGLFK